MRSESDEICTQVRIVHVLHFAFFYENKNHAYLAMGSDGRSRRMEMFFPTSITATRLQV